MGWDACGNADRLLGQRGEGRVVALKIGATWAGAEWVGNAGGSLEMGCRGGQQQSDIVGDRFFRVGESCCICWHLSKGWGSI